ncbi:MAG: hypothetical protein OEY86_11510, partial [Nitrospira sp.]|nr:hypothetical protein [Nitrospira sp.]
MELKPGFSITIQPAGITLSTPAPITLPNTDNLPAGNKLDLWSLSPDTGTFYVAGQMQVSADGTRLETISGGVRKTAWHFALAPSAAVPPVQNRVTGGCTECGMNGAEGDLTEGTLTQTVTVPGVRTQGVSRDLTLQYNSMTADATPILPITATLDVRAAVPQTFSADLTVGGLKQGNRGYWDASVMSETTTSSTRMGVSYDGTALPTGRYPYELVLYSNYSQSSIGAVTTGQTILRNEQASPFGVGWNLRGVDRLLTTPLGDMAILAQGTGHTVPFVSASAANLVSWWQGEGTATDLINGNHGTPVGGLAYASGQIGQAFAFDGVDDAIDIPDSTSLDSLTTAATISLWAKPEPPEGASNLGYLFYRYDPAAGQGLGLAVNIAGAVAFTVRTTVASSIFYTAPGAVAFGDISHIAATVDTATGQTHIYVNGVDIPHTAVLGAEIVSGTLVNVDALYLGRRYGGGVVDDAYYKGLMDEVWLYSRALPGTEINAIYTAGGIREMASTFLPPPGDTSTLTKEADGTYTRRLKDGTVYRFNPQGYQTSMADRNGNTTTYAYTGSQQLSTITDPVGEVTTLAYNGSRLATLTDPAGRVTQFTHDSAGNLLAVEAPDQTRTTFQYDARHR